MREISKRTIDGYEYEFTQLGARDSLKLSVRLGKILGKPLGLGISAIKDKKAKSWLDAQIDSSVLGQAVQALFDSMDQNEVVDIVEGLVGKDKVLCDGKPVVFNSHYAGRLDHLMRVLLAALEVQYGNFFDALRGALEKASPTPTTPAP